MSKKRRTPSRHAAQHHPSPAERDERHSLAGVTFEDAMKALVASSGGEMDGSHEIWIADDDTRARVLADPHVQRGIADYKRRWIEHDGDIPSIPYDVAMKRHTEE